METVGAVPQLAAEVRVRRLGRVSYQAAMSVQDALLAEVTAAPEARGAILVVEHDPVYTLGRGADEADLLGAPERLGVPVFRVGRGGGATFHGPGQLVVYPVVRLPGRGLDVQSYVRSLERALVATCRRFAVAAHRIDGQIGVWTAAGKIGSVGIGVKRGVAFHGLSLNVDNRIDYFESIVTCRAPGMAVTTLACAAAVAPSLAAVADVLVAELCRELDLIPVEEPL